MLHVKVHDEIVAKPKRVLMRDFLDRVAIPRRDLNFNHAVADDFTLARQATVALKTRRLFNAILLRLRRGTEMLHTLHNINVAGTARAHAAARMLTRGVTGMFVLTLVEPVDAQLPTWIGTPV